MTEQRNEAYELVVAQQQSEIEALRAQLAEERQQKHEALHREYCRRYQRLRILGAAPLGSDALKNGTVLRFQSLDAFIDYDLKHSNNRGEADFSAPTPPTQPQGDGSLRRDAERYRWLAKTRTNDPAYNEVWACWPDGDLGEAIDAAMEASNENA